MDKEVKALIERLRRRSDVEVRQGAKHPFVVTSDGVFVVSLPTTPSDHRWLKNTLSALRRAGINLEEKEEGKVSGKKSGDVADVALSKHLRERLHGLRKTRGLTEMGVAKLVHSFYPEGSEVTVDAVRHAAKRVMDGGAVGPRIGGMMLEAVAVAELAPAPSAETSEDAPKKRRPPQPVGSHDMADAAPVVRKLHETLKRLGEHNRVKPTERYPYGFRTMTDFAEIAVERLTEQGVDLGSSRGDWGDPVHAMQALSKMLRTPHSNPTSRSVRLIEKFVEAVEAHIAGPNTANVEEPSPEAAEPTGAPELVSTVPQAADENGTTPDRLALEVLAAIVNGRHLNKQELDHAMELAGQVAARA